MRVHQPICRVLPILLVLCLVAVMTVPLTAFAGEPEQKVVRVGWYESSFCYWDQFGRRCGIDYEYQHRISAYTGWQYEYVEDSWSNLLQMLKAGEIDLLSDVSYKPERTEYMSFPDIPMGSEAYYIYIDAENRDITAENLQSFAGKRIGVNVNSVQEGFLKDWVQKNGVSIEIVPLDVSESESLDMLMRGEIDGFTTIYSRGSDQKIIPVCRIGASEYFYAVNRNRPDLLAELNMALSGIQDEDPYFQQRIYDENQYSTNTSTFLTPAQEDWLKTHGVIRVGYREDFLPFCHTDSQSGELTGALKDYLAHAVNYLRTSNIRFEAVPYVSTEAALEAMEAGQVDCVFPVYMSSYDADERGIRLTSPAMKTEMNAVMRDSQEQGISRDSRITFAVNAGDVSLDAYIMDQYPQSARKPLADSEACYAAVASGEADSVLISNYRVLAAEDRLKQYRLFNVPTGEALFLSFAVNQADRELYFILNKTVVITNSGDMDAALASYMQTSRRVTFGQFMKDNWVAMLAAVCAVFAVIVVLLLQKLKAERKANEQQRIMEDSLRRELQQKEQLQSAMEMAYRDPLTGVKSKHAYNEAETRMDQRIAAGEVSGFSVVVFDLNNLKQINDSQGHETGDEYIRDACKLICTVFKHSPVFRIGGDEFTAILEGEDFDNQDELLERFEKQVLDNPKRDKSVVAFGCSRFVPGKDTGIRMVFERADAAMYREKLLLKNIIADNGGNDAKQPERLFNTEDISVIHVRKHILIADDVVSNREILGDLLEEEYDIIYASDGVEALDELRRHKDDIALVILDLYMPNMAGQEVIAQMQVDEELMAIPVIVLTVDQAAELECLRLGAMDFIPKPYPDIEIVKARISKCIELSENRDLIRRTQRDRLTGLFNIDYFIRYVNRFDQHYKGYALDAVLFDINRFYLLNEQYGRQFGDLVLRSIGISIQKLARKTGGIACRQEDDTFLLYCPHRSDYEALLEKFMDELFVDPETASKVTLRIGVYLNAQEEHDIEERFVRAGQAANVARNDPNRLFGYYQPVAR